MVHYLDSNEYISSATLKNQVYYSHAKGYSMQMYNTVHSSYSDQGYYVGVCVWVCESVHVWEVCVWVNVCVWVGRCDGVSVCVCVYVLLDCRNDWSTILTSTHI